MEPIIQPATKSIEELFEETAILHGHLCPRQVLGVRMGLWAGELLAMELPQTAKRLLAIVETDGCFADGVSVATNCWLGRRTLRIEDYGKIAVTFIDTQPDKKPENQTHQENDATRPKPAGSGWRIIPHPKARKTAHQYAPEAKNRWQAMPLGYQRMPIDELLIAQPVQLATPVADLISRAGYRVLCDRCGEEIINEREIQQDGQTLCRSCAGTSYYHLCPR